MEIFGIRIEPALPPGSLLQRLKQQRTKIKEATTKLDILIAKLENDPELESILDLLK